MARTPICQLCEAGTEAAFILSNLTSGETRYICILCAAPHFADLANQVAEFIGDLARAEGAPGATDAPTAEGQAAEDGPSSPWPHTERTVRGAAHRRAKSRPTAQEVIDNQPEREPFGAAEE